MKHKSIVLLSVLAVAGALVLAVNTNNNAVQNAKVHASAVTKQVKQNLATRQKLQSQVNTLTLQVSNLSAQCQAGQKDYKLLTSTQKLQGSLPVCAFQDTTAVQ